MPDPIDCGKPYCPEHVKNTNLINKHSGILLVLLLALGGQFWGGWLFIEKMDQHVEKIEVSGKAVEKSVINMDRNFASHIAASSQRMSSIDRRIDGCILSDNDHESRIRTLEKRKL